MVGKALTNREVKLGAGHVLVDGVAADESVLVEIYAHQGKMVGAQPKKVATDALKLITLARERPEARLILAFADEIAARRVTQKSWIAEALRAWGIEVFVAELTEDEVNLISDAQVKQRMTNT